MEITNKKAWSKWVESNKDRYGKAIIDYAEAWANLMESRMSEGATLESIAKTTSHETDTEGITGFMYGAAVSVLSSCWKHGEELRRWHNLDTQIHDEGVKANAMGAVLNPALLNIKV